MLLKRLLALVAVPVLASARLDRASNFAGRASAMRDDMKLLDVHGGAHTEVGPSPSLSVGSLLAWRALGTSLPLVGADRRLSLAPHSSTMRTFPAIASASRRRVVGVIRTRSQ